MTILTHEEKASEQNPTSFMTKRLAFLRSRAQQVLLPSPLLSIVLELNEQSGQKRNKSSLDCKERSKTTTDTYYI